MKLILRITRTDGTTEDHELDGAEYIESGRRLISFPPGITLWNGDRFQITTDVRPEPPLQPDTAEDHTRPPSARPRHGTNDLR